MSDWKHPSDVAHLWRWFGHVGPSEVHRCDCGLYRVRTLQSGKVAEWFTLDEPPGVKR